MSENERIDIFYMTPTDFVDFADMEIRKSGEYILLYPKTKYNKELEELGGATMVEVRIVRPAWYDKVPGRAKYKNANERCSECGRFDKDD